jgi:hypothetical protein
MRKRVMPRNGLKVGLGRAPIHLAQIAAAKRRGRETGRDTIMM